MESLSMFPEEVICRILCFLTAQDVVRLRPVSKQIHDITHDPAIWRTLYANACLPRAPGPFPSQPVRFLERALVHSERLARSWTTQPLRDISSIRIPLEGVSSESLTSPSRIMHGKWLVDCESSRKFVVYDIDSETVPPVRNVLWEHEHKWQIREWDAHPATSSEGLLIIVIFQDLTPDNQDSSWKLLEFRMDGNSGRLYHSLTLDVPVSGLQVYPCSDGGHSAFVPIDYHNLVFDAETRLFCEFPVFRSELDIVPSDWHLHQRTHPKILLTKTHVITLHDKINSGTISTEWSILIQAFTSPTNAQPACNGTAVLRLSHEGAFRSNLPGQCFRIVRNSIADPMTESISIRLLSQVVKGRGIHFSCTDLTLPKHASTEMNTVLPMTIRVHDIITDNMLSRSPTSQRTHVKGSDDGHMRGFFRFLLVDDAPGIQPPKHFTLRFTIDASQDRCVAVLGQLLPPKWSQTVFPPHFTSIAFDGVGGKLCWDTESSVNGDITAVITNIE